jgi:lipid II:glycine glycyltransferase (peptidoglycan interpeptide bridge formation enzyme)
MDIQLRKKIGDIDKAKWRDFVTKHPNGTVFQSPEMYDLFETSDKFYPCIFAAYRGDKLCGILLAVIIREYTGLLGRLSSRTVIYGGPLLDESQEPKLILDVLLKALIEEVKNKSIFIQFRNFFDWNAYNSVFNSNNFWLTDRLNLIVKVDGLENTLKRISKSKVRQVRKALQAGAEIIVPDKVAEIRQFYDILWELYRDKVKKPLPSWSFFRNFFEKMNNGREGIYLLIRYRGKIIGGVLCPIHADKAIYEWYVCGLDNEYKELYPSVLATWAPIDYALKHQISSFDFMGVGKPNKDYGVREFKAKFGGEMVNYGRYGRINNKVLYVITEIGYNFLTLIHQI